MRSTIYSHTSIFDLFNSLVAERFIARLHLHMRICVTSSIYVNCVYPPTIITQLDTECTFFDIHISHFTKYVQCVIYDFFREISLDFGVVRIMIIFVLLPLLL